MSEGSKSGRCGGGMDWRILGRLTEVTVSDGDSLPDPLQLIFNVVSGAFYAVRVNT